MKSERSKKCKKHKWVVLKQMIRPLRKVIKRRSTKYCDQSNKDKQTLVDFDWAWPNMSVRPYLRMCKKCGIKMERHLVDDGDGNCFEIHEGTMPLRKWTKWKKVKEAK